jgi:hypothetical protein
MFDYARSGLPPFNSLTVLMMIVWTFIFYQAIQVLWFERTLPTYIYEESILDPEAIVRGHLMTMQIKLVRSRPCTTIVTRYIQDSDGTRDDLQATFAQSQKTGYEHYTRQFIVPRYLALGPARIYVTSSYQCHWSHVVWPVVNTRSYDFTITE